MFPLRHRTMDLKLKSPGRIKSSEVSYSAFLSNLKALTRKVTSLHTVKGMDGQTDGQRNEINLACLFLYKSFSFSKRHIIFHSRSDLDTKFYIGVTS